MADYNIRDDEDAIRVFTPLATYIITKGNWTLIVKPTHYLKISRHNYLVEKLIKQLIKEGVTRINADGEYDATLTRSLSLTCGQARADIVFENNEGLNYVEVETRERLGENHTAEQLQRMVQGTGIKWLAVETHALNHARELLRLLNLQHVIRIMEIRTI